MGIPVLTFTAYSNTGKTTYLEKLIPCLKSAGLRIAVIKHDAHDFQADIEGKDSWRFAQAGADIVAVASKRQFALFQYSSFDLSAIITQIHNVDLILTEGYKHEHFPKIAIYRAASGNGLSIPLKDCLAIVGDYPSPAPVLFFHRRTPASCRLSTTASANRSPDHVKRGRLCPFFLKAS